MKYTIQQAAHHRALESLRHPKITAPGLLLWRKLRRAESKLSAIALAWCNGTATMEDWDTATARATESVVKALGREPNGLYLNADPRGYSLKIDGWEHIPAGMHRDMGGYGILAPIIES